MADFTIATPLADGGARVELAARQPIGRLGTPEEIAAMVHYICSPEAEFMTGSVVTIDGGWTAA